MNNFIIKINPLFGYRHSRFSNFYGLGQIFFTDILIDLRSEINLYIREKSCLITDRECPVIENQPAFFWAPKCPSYGKIHS